MLTLGYTRAVATIRGIDMIHKLKIEPNYLDELIAKRKKSEIRFNDRAYQLGDTLEFQADRAFAYRFKITHIHSGLGLLPGYVVLSVEKIGA